eukprot:COSAG06_NODE_90_length_24779_cov_33.515843_27_plen_161_part_00
MMIMMIMMMMMMISIICQDRLGTNRWKVERKLHGVFGFVLFPRKGAHRYPTAWTGDVGDGLQVRKRVLFAPLYAKTHHFTKTGSGQRYGKLRKRGVFPLLQDLADSVSLFPAAFAGHFWGTYSVDLGPYADGLDQYKFPTNGVRYPLRPTYIYIYIYMVS